MTLSIIIVSYNTRELLEDCLISIRKSLVGGGEVNLANTEVIIVDNHSTDTTPAFLKKLEKKEIKTLLGLKTKIIFNQDNTGFAYANNQGIRRAGGKYILLLNSDTIINNNNLWRKTLIFLKQNPSVGILGPKLQWENGQTQPSGGFFPTLPRLLTWALMIDDLPVVNKIIKPYHPHAPGFYTKDNYYQKPHRQDWVTGACFFVRRSVIDKIGLLDEKIFMYTEEMEFCYRAKRAGFKVVYYPQAFLIHLGGKSGTSLLTAQNEFRGIKYFYQKHQPGWQQTIANFLLKTAAQVRKTVFSQNQTKKDIYQQVLTEL